MSGANHRGRRRLCSPRLVIFLFAILSFPALAQEPVPLPRLRESAAELQRLIDLREAALATEKNSDAEEIARLEEERGRLASELLDEEEAALDLETRIEELRDLKEAEARSDAEWSAALLTLATSARVGLERLQLALADLPGWEEESEDLGTALAESLANGAIDDTLRSSASFLPMLQRALRVGSRLHLREVELWTARGRREKVRLLALGHLAFAYRSEDGGLGLAVASPSEARGLRWREELPGPIRAALNTAFDSVREGSSPTLLLPIDPSGRMRSDTLQAAPDLLQRFREGGLLMGPLVAVALLALGLAAERAWILFARNRSGASLARRVLEAVSRGRFDEAETACHRRDDVVARTLQACLERREQGASAMEDAVQAQMLAELPRLQRFLRGLAILAAVAPLLGLLGTVTGIIRTFAVLKAFGNANPSHMAGGISEALVTTVGGLVIAVPILLLHSLLSGRSDQIVAAAEKHAARLLDTLVHASRSGAEPDA